MITQKEFQDGQKEEFKARLVARGFQEESKPQSDNMLAKMSFIEEEQNISPLYKK